MCKPYFVQESASSDMKLSSIVIGVGLHDLYTLHTE